MRLVGVTRSCTVLFLAAFVFGGARIDGLVAHAQTASAIQTPSEMPSLPDAEKNPAARLNIDSFNISHYRALLPADVVSLIKQDKANIAASSSLRYVWRYDDQWMQNSMKPEPSLLASTGALTAKPPMQRGFLFGPEEMLRREADSVRRGQMTLWNLVSAWWSQPVVQVQLSVNSLKERHLRERLSGELSRVFVNQAVKEDRTNQVFREIVRFTKPEGLAFLSFAFADQDEDAFWIYSPAIRKVRQLTGSNRGDGLFNAGWSLEDIFVWSGKVAAVRPSFDQAVTLLAPFAGLETLLIEPLPGNPACMAWTPQPGPAERWHYDQGGRAASDLPFPSDTVFVPRSLWRLELSPEDPFATFGRQILFVDPASMLPAYKIVYKRSGELWKLVIGGFALGVNRDLTWKMPLPSFTLVHDFPSQTTTILDYTSVIACSRLDDNNLPLSSFDPRHLGPSESASPGTISTANNDQ